MDRRISALLSLAFLTGCVNPHVKEADALAKSGDWDGALAAYREALDRHPEDPRIVERLERATARVISREAEKAFQAEKEGRLDQAGAGWAQVLSLCGPRVHPAECARVSQAIEREREALIAAGDAAGAAERWEDALAAYGAVLSLHPDWEEVKVKDATAQRGFAVQLEREAEELSKEDLLGAALVTDLRALRHDPLQAQAFQEGRLLRQAIRSRADVTVEGPRVEAGGHKAFGKALSRTVRPHLDDFQSYTTEKTPGAMVASLKVTVLDLKEEELKAEGLDYLPNDDPTPVENPALAVEQAKVADLAAEVSRLEREGGSKKAYQRARTALRAELALLEGLPRTVPPPRTWALDFTQVTRTVTATVRFELSEPDLSEPVVQEVTHSVSRVVRTHPACPRHHVRATDPTAVPSYQELASELAGEFRDGASVLEAARGRRVESLLASGRQELSAGHPSKAIDAFVEVVFLLGPAGLPEDAAGFLARSMDAPDGFRELVAMN